MGAGRHVPVMPAWRRGGRPPHLQQAPLCLRVARLALYHRTLHPHARRAGGLVFPRLGQDEPAGGRRGDACVCTDQARNQAGSRSVEGMQQQCVLLCRCKGRRAAAAPTRGVACQAKSRRPPRGRTPCEPCTAARSVCHRTRSTAGGGEGWLGGAHLARSSSLLSNSTLKAASQISSASGLRMKASSRIDRAPATSPAGADSAGRRGRWRAAGRAEAGATQGFRCVSRGPAHSPSAVSSQAGGRNAHRRPGPRGRRAGATATRQRALIPCLHRHACPLINH